MIEITFAYTCILKAALRSVWKGLRYAKSRRKTSYCAASHDISVTIYNKDPLTFHSGYNPQRAHHRKVEKRQRQEHGGRVKEEERDIRAALWKNWSNPRKASTLGWTLYPNCPLPNRDTLYKCQCGGILWASLRNKKKKPIKKTLILHLTYKALEYFFNPEEKLQHVCKCNTWDQ